MGNLCCFPVTIPIGTDAPVTGIGKSGQTFPAASQTAYETDGTSSTTYANAKDYTDYVVEQDPNNTGYPNIRANLSAATGVSVNDLKEAWAFQTYQENRYKFGSRYSEYVKHLGGYDGNSALNRPELLGVSSVDISISEVLQTAPDSGTSTVVGEMKGHGIAGVKGKRVFKWFGEHGQLLGLMAIRPEAIYTNGPHRS